MVRHLKVSDEVYEQVVRLQGFLQARDGKRYTVDEVLKDLLAVAAEIGCYSMELVPEEEGKTSKSPFKVFISKELIRGMRKKGETKNGNAV